MVPPTEIRSGPARARLLAVLVLVVLAFAGVVSRPARAAAQANVTVKNYSFSEPDLVIDPGTEVTWTATQGDHTVTSTGGSFDEMIAQDYSPHSFSYTFTKPGRYTYYCGFHRAKGMEAVVEVTDPSGGPTTTEPPTTTTTWSAPTTTTSAPATTTAPPVTATTSAPTVPTALPVPTSTTPATAPPASTTTAPAASPPATTRPVQAGPAKTAVTGSPATTAPVAASATTVPPPSEVAPAGDAPASPDVQAVAAPAPEIRLQAGGATSPPAGRGDGNGPAMGLLLGVAGLLALAGGGAAVWRHRH